MIYITLTLANMISKSGVLSGYNIELSNSPANAFIQLDFCSICLYGSKSTILCSNGFQLWANVRGFLLLISMVDDFILTYLLWGWHTGAVVSTVACSPCACVDPGIPAHSTVQRQAR